MTTLIVTTVLGYVSGILGTMTVPALQRWLAKRSTYTQKKSLQSAQAEYMDVTAMALHPEYLAPELVTRVLWFTVTCFAFLVVLDANVSFSAPGAPSFHFHAPRNVQIGFVILYFLVKVFMVTLAVKLGLNAYMLYYNVRFFPRYVETVPAPIRDIDLEQAIIAGRALRRCAVMKETDQTTNGVSAEAK